MKPALTIVQQQPIQSLVVEIRAHLYDAKNAEARRDKLRLHAGQKLLWLRARIEAGEEGKVSWWEWFETQDLGSRSNAEKLMRIAGADDPDTALEADRAANRERERDVRRRASVPSHVMEEPEADNYDPVSDAFEIIEQMDEDQLERFIALFKEQYL